MFAVFGYFQQLSCLKSEQVRHCLRSSAFDIGMGNCSTSKRSQSYGSPASLGFGTGNSTEPSKSVHSVIHEGPILGLCYGGPSQLITCGDDKRIAILDLKDMLVKEEFVPRYLAGHTKAVNRVMSVQQDLWSCSRDLSIRKVRAHTH